jgi:anti-anti-sigma factor
MMSATTMSRFGVEDIPEPLQMEQYRHGDTAVVIASGEIDLSSADLLRAKLHGLLDSCRRLVLDLREVDFMDASGLHCVLDIDDASRAVSVEFALVPGPPAVQRLFEITRTADRLRFTEPERR